MKTIDTKLEVMLGCRGDSHQAEGESPDCERVRMVAGGTGFFTGRVLEITVCACPCHVAESPEREALLKLMRGHTPTVRLSTAPGEASPSSVGAAFRHPPL